MTVDHPSNDVYLKGLKFTLPAEDIPPQLYPQRVASAVNAGVERGELNRTMAHVLGRLLGDDGFSRLAAALDAGDIAVSDIPAFMNSIYHRYGWR